MAPSIRRLIPVGTLALLIATAACTSERAGQMTQAAGSAPARVTMRLAPGQLPALMTVLSSRVMAADEDSGEAGDSDATEFTRVDTSDVDSLVVNVTQVQIRGNGSSEDGQGEGNQPDSAKSDSGRGDLRLVLKADQDSGGSDSAKRGDDQEGHDGWITLNVTGNGHLNLVHLPTSADSGVTVATDSVPPGVYEHLRLFVTGPMIFFRKDVVTPSGDTLKAGTGYPVFIPSADSTGAAMRTDEQFVIPTGGGSVPVFFDKDDTIRHIAITGNGTIIVPPVIR